MCADKIKKSPESDDDLCGVTKREERIPEWARSPELFRALMAQEGKDLRDLLPKKPMRPFILEGTPFFFSVM